MRDYVQIRLWRNIINESLRSRLVISEAYKLEIFLFSLGDLGRADGMPCSQLPVAVCDGGCQICVYIAKENAPHNERWLSEWAINPASPGMSLESACHGILGIHRNVVESKRSLTRSASHHCVGW
jgi:hypothetical protein